MKVSILSQRASRGDQQQKLGGKIRPGIKVLTRAAGENATAVKLYNDGLAKRMKFSEIEKLIRDKTGLSNPMYPRNTAYFNVAASDFGMPEIANLIVEKYGEMRDGDTVKRLYRFPVVFHSDDLNEVYPNEFKRYGGEPNYESHYGEDGVRYCRYLPEVTQQMLAEQKARRIKRPPRREKVIRGKCDPHTCVEFLQGQCKFRGRLHFYIPGIPTTGLLAMETTSEYAAEAIWADLDRIRNAFGGIPRTNPNKPGAHIFYITKVQEQRTYFDEHGKKQIGVQWVPKLQADIDIGTVLVQGHVHQLTSSVAPVAWLGSPKGMPEAAQLPAPEGEAASNGDTQANISAGSAVSEGEQQGLGDRNDPADQLFAILDDMGIDQAFAISYFDLKLDANWENDNDKLLSAIDQMVNLRRVGDECAKLVMHITVKVHQVGLDAADFQRYATAKYGRGYSAKETVLRAIITELDGFRGSDAQSVRAFITAQLENAVIQ